MEQSFTKAERLTKKNDIKNVFEKGKIHRGNDATAYVLLNDNRRISRFGIIVKKKFGNAVVRNRAKRIFREAYRMNKGLLLRYVDIIILPNSREITLRSAEQYLKELFEQINK